MINLKDLIIKGVSMLQTLSFKSKRKRFPLLSLGYQVKFLLADGEFQLKAQEISNEEIRVECAAGDIPRLVPRTAHHSPDEKIVHKAVLLLGDNLNLEVNAQVLICRRYSQLGFNVSLRLVGLRAEQEEQLEDFLQKAMARDTPVASMLG